MLPKIYIDYDGTYDEAIHSLIEKKHTKLAHAGGRLFARRLRKTVTPMLNKILMGMEAETGLSWKWPEIRCYVAHDIPFDYDNPMTIKVRKNMHDATETFFHELVHQLEMQNENKIIMRNPIHLKYKREHRLWPEHYRGWQIVKREGADNIINAYVRPATPLHALKKAVEHKMEETQKPKVLSKKEKAPKQKPLRNK